MSYTKNHRKQRSKKYRYIAIFFALALISVSVLEMTHVIHFFHRATPASRVIVKIGSTSRPPQNNSSQQQATPDKNSITNTSGSSDSGRAADTHGQAVVTTPANQWISSTSGDIILKQPTAAGAELANGSMVSGSAKVSQVQYRLIDNSSGVIAQGILTVNNGNFSGTLQFNHQSSTGRLDIFSFDAQGDEINEIQLGVRLG